MREALERAWNHVEWANERVAGALAAVAHEARAAEAHRLFAHVVAAEEVWLERVAGRTPPRGPWPAAEPPADLERTRRHVTRVRELLAAGDLDRVIAYTTTKGVAHQTRLSDILLHVALHGAYHRGQVAWLLRRESLEPVATDYVLMVRERS